MSNKIKIILAILMAFSLSACVTINIYFPTAAAEKAADKIIDEIWDLKSKENTNIKDAK